jgi:ceramide glucosyltransferase
MLTVSAKLVLLSVGGAAIAYLLLAIGCVWRFQPGGAPDPSYRPGITILKPLCSADHDLYERLRSFCLQNYQDLQIIFGVAASFDPALQIVRQIMAEFPEHDLVLVIDGMQHGASRKVSNLINMMTVAKHGIVIASDSDARISHNCLGALVRPFADPTVGAVTAPLRAIPGPGFASALSSLLINDWYLPQMLITETFGPTRACLAPLTAVRRDTLDAIGGFAAVADQSADDFKLGQLIAGRGDRVLISRIMVDVMVHEDFASLTYRELRWSRIIRATEPKGHFWSVVTHTLPIILPLLLISSSRAGLALVFVTAILRIVLNRLVCARLGLSRRPPWWLVFMREAASLAIWLACYTGRRVTWRGANFTVRPGGDMRLKAANGAPALHPVPRRRLSVAVLNRKCVKLCDRVAHREGTG